MNLFSLAGKVAVVTGGGSDQQVELILPVPAFTVDGTPPRSEAFSSS